MCCVWKIAEALDLPSCEMARDFEPLEQFGPSFSSARLYAVRAMADALLGDEPKEQRKSACLGVAEGARH